MSVLAQEIEDREQGALESPLFYKENKRNGVIKVVKSIVKKHEAILEAKGIDPDDWHEETFKSVMAEMTYRPTKHQRNQLIEFKRKEEIEAFEEEMIELLKEKIEREEKVPSSEKQNSLINSNSDEPEGGEQ